MKNTSSLREIQLMMYYALYRVVRYRSCKKHFLNCNSIGLIEAA